MNRRRWTAAAPWVALSYDESADERRDFWHRVQRRPYLRRPASIRATQQLTDAVSLVAVLSALVAPKNNTAATIRAIDAGLTHSINTLIGRSTHEEANRTPQPTPVRPEPLQRQRQGPVRRFLRFLVGR